LTRFDPKTSEQIRRHTADLIALILAIVGFLGSALVTQRVFEGVPHIEDEIAYVWQAKALIEGHLRLPSPPESKSFLVPFVVDYQGERFSKYPPGWPIVLAAAIKLNARAWINPLLAGLGVWLTYVLGKRIFSSLVGLLAAGLTVTSPFFLMNSGSLLSHPLGYVLSATFALCWLESFWPRSHDQSTEKQASLKKQWLFAALAAIALGWLMFTRPLTALAVALPFGIHAIVLLIRGDTKTRLRVIAFGLAELIFVGLYLLWQYSLTGNALLNPYVLWWPYDQIGFGPGHGRGAAGHTLNLAWINLRSSMNAGKYDLFGWGTFSWIFLPFGLWASRRNAKGLLIAGVTLSLVIVYMAYWIGATLFGPRYYYEGLYSVTLISAAGIAWLAGWPVNQNSTYVRYYDWRKLRPLLVTLVVGVLVGINLTLYLPARLNAMNNLYGISRADQAPFITPSAQALTPALVAVYSDRWMEYGALLDLENPELTSPFIFVWGSNPDLDAALAKYFPDRAIYHYFPGKSTQLFKVPESGP
jgi:hypothetical protein